ncbi:MAG: pyruvate, phosphate dikinase, partial [Christensenellaceae bacterium]|nr:pyruvate, phosphate dikinase [Christensenellaceae bacterium]
MTKYTYLFSEGNAGMRNLLGGKGANLAEMTNLGLPVPQGFVVTTEACTRYYEDGRKITDDIVEQIFDALSKTEAIVGKKFGDLENPFLVSVRSGSRASMPGMMDTILNLGLNDIAVQGLAKQTGNDRFAYDSYRRFIQMFSDVVMEVNKAKFEAVLTEIKNKNNYEFDYELTGEELKEVVNKYKAIFFEEKGFEFPQDPREQLIASIEAVFRSWNNDRAVYYRRMNDIPSSWGTAVNVQAMVFGNSGDNSGSGVAFSRNPATGEPGLLGEYLMNSQGEDVVAGIRTPSPLSELKKNIPHLYDKFNEIAIKLEKHYKDMQDMEFTIENGNFYILQTRSGKRTANAALKIAVDMVNEGLISSKEALMLVEPKQLDSLLHPHFDEEALKNYTPIACGLPASPGAATGKIYFTAKDAAEAATKGIDVILVRDETTTEDIEGMDLSKGILTARGGMTSHAAVVARGMGRTAVVGCGALMIDEEAKTLTVGETVLKEGDEVSINGVTGNIYVGHIPAVEAEVTGDFAKLMSWADEVRTLKVRANSDNPRDTEKAVEFGAEGIGLCRTEHMFFEGERIASMCKMILADTAEQREKALAELLPMQQGDFEGMYRALEGRPMTIRYLDPPLHEFLPQKTMTAEIENLAKDMNLTYDEVINKIDALHEVNPMMGHRGCRLSVTYPEIAKMQTRAVIQAALAVRKEKGWDIVPEIMIPLV